MRKDLRIKIRPDASFSSKYIRHQLMKLLELSRELAGVYQTYPRLRRVVGREAWQQLTDTVYQELLMLNLKPGDARLRKQITKDSQRLEDILGSTVTRDHAGLKDTLSRVLMFRITHRQTARNN